MRGGEQYRVRVFLILLKPHPTPCPWATQHAQTCSCSTEQQIWAGLLGRLRLTRDKGMNISLPCIELQRQQTCIQLAYLFQHRSGLHCLPFFLIPPPALVGPWWEHTAVYQPLTATPKQASLNTSSHLSPLWALEKYYLTSRTKGEGMKEAYRGPLSCMQLSLSRIDQAVIFLSGEG